VPRPSTYREDLARLLHHDGGLTAISYAHPKLHATPGKLLDAVAPPQALMLVIGEDETS
jgi:hypothetical protein